MKNFFLKFSSLFLVLGLLAACSNESPVSTEDEIIEIVENSIEKEEGVQVEGPFGIESGIINYEMKKLDGTVTATSTFYFDDYGNRLKLEETIDGETSVYMFDENSGKGLTAFPGRDPSNISMRQGELNMLVAMHSTSGYTQQEDETIAGKNCIVYANNAVSAEGESQHVYCKHEGVLFKDLNRLGGGYILEAIRFENSKPGADVFSALDDLE